MNKTNEQLREDIREIEKEVKDLVSKKSIIQSELNEKYKLCNHNWTEPVRKVKIYEASEMEIFKRELNYVPSSEKASWERTCDICGKIEITYMTADKIEKVPVFFVN